MRTSGTKPLNFTTIIISVMVAPDVTVTVNSRLFKLQFLLPIAS